MASVRPTRPNAEETRIAVRWVDGVTAVLGIVYLLWAALYGVSSPVMAYGRSDPQSWARYKLAEIESAEDGGRPHGGAVVWLVGSSVMRAGFDEADANEALEERGIPWRVQKFGQARGASGLSAAVVKALPLRPGDIVLHNVMLENFHREWLALTKMPADRLAVWLEPRAFWSIEEWSLSRKLDQAAAVPSDFWTYHDEFAAGLLKWLEVPFTGKKPRRAKQQANPTWSETQARLERARSRGEDSWYYLQASEIDLSPTQFNVAGLEDMRRTVAAAGAELVLADLPPRQEYLTSFLAPEARTLWASWLDAQPELVRFPPPPEDGFQDMKHANEIGRAVFTQALVDWLATDRASRDLRSTH